MKKSILLLSVLGASAAVNAQSSVSLSGTVDNAVNRVTGSISSKSQLVSGANSTTKLAFRGQEDLGGGMYASFWLETGLNGDTGIGTATNTNNQPSGAIGGTTGIVFNRRASVELGSKTWGAVEAGRLWSPTYDAFTSRYDLFGVGVGIGLNYTSSINPNQVRVSNGIGYITPNFNGFYAKAQHWFGENASNVATADDGTGNGIMLAYENGPWSARAHYARTNFAAGDAIYRAVAAYYDSGVFRIAGNINRDEQGVLEQKGFNIGGLYRIGVGEAKLTYAQLKTNATAAGPQSRKISIGYVHNLSKRTAIYTTFAHLTNKNGAALAIAGSTTAANQSSKGFDLGIRHNVGSDFSTVSGRTNRKFLQAGLWRPVASLPRGAFFVEPACRAGRVNCIRTQKAQPYETRSEKESPRHARLGGRAGARCGPSVGQARPPEPPDGRSCHADPRRGGLPPRVDVRGACAGARRRQKLGAWFHPRPAGQGLAVRGRSPFLPGPRRLWPDAGQRPHPCRPRHPRGPAGSARGDPAGGFPGCPRGRSPDLRG
jgi:predicted porin